MKKKIFMFVLLFWLGLAGPAITQEVNPDTKIDEILQWINLISQKIEKENRLLLSSIYFFQQAVGQQNPFYQEVEGLKAETRRSVKLIAESRELLVQAVKANKAKDRKKAEEKIHEIIEKAKKADQNNRKTTDRLSEIIDEVDKNILNPKILI